MVKKEKVLMGRKAVEAYRKDHLQLHSKPWHKNISKEHTPLLKTLINDLENIGFTSTKTEYEAKKNEILDNFSKDSNEQCLIDTGIFDEMIRQNREDLFLISGTRSPNVGILDNKDGVSIKIIEDKKGIEAKLIIDGVEIMWTHPEEHVLMRDSVKECLDNARVFIGGLGFGLVTLYLADSGKVNEIIVCENDDRVIQLMGEKVKNYFAQNYPDIEFNIIKGDAFEEVTKQGLFDWIYIDLSNGAPSEFVDITKPFLTEKGIYSPYKSYSSSWG